MHTIGKNGFPGARFPALQSCRLLLKKIIQNYSIGLLASSILLFCLWLPLIGKTDDSTLLSLDRIGVYGWSGGGLMSLLLIFRYPDLYQTAMAGAYLSNHRFYHAGFTERFLGLPQDNPDAYRNTAALMYAKNLRGNLLLMHGTGDDNVHYQNTEALINELIAYKKRFSLMIYPNRSHGLPEGENTQYHRYDMYTWYLNQNLPAGGR